jgi:hypothetical protein
MNSQQSGVEEPQPNVTVVEICDPPLWETTSRLSKQNLIQLRSEPLRARRVAVRLAPPLAPLSKIHRKDISQAVNLSIRRIGRIVLMLVIPFQFKVFADRELRTGGQRRPAPLLKPPIVEDFCAEVWREVKGTHREGPFCRYPVTIPPGKYAIDIPQISAIPVGQQHPPDEWEATCSLNSDAMLRRALNCG